MAPQRMAIAEIMAALPKQGRILVSGCSAESLLFADAVMRSGDLLGGPTFTGIFVPGLNRHSYLANDDCCVETFFMTDELKASGAAVRFLPLCYNDILNRFRRIPIDAALCMVAPPDENGRCSFGPVVDFLAELWPHIPLRYAHVNPAMPRTHGHAGIPFSELTGYVEVDQPLLEMADSAAGGTVDAIASHIAGFIGDSTTLQMGLGKIPGAILRRLSDRRHLRLYSGLIGDAVVELEEAGALAPGVAVTAGVAIGTHRLYKAIEGPSYQFQPVSITHSSTAMAGIKNFISINSALQVDLFGQAYAEFGARGLMSGPGGASDYARAARLNGGLRVVALAATALRDSVSRIVMPSDGAGPVSLGRMDIDLVVTEYGVADLRDYDHQSRAASLIAIAAPAFRDQLTGAWRSYANRF